MLALIFLSLLHGALAAVSESFTSTPDCSRPVCPDGVVEITCTHTNNVSGLTSWSGTLPGDTCNTILGHGGLVDSACIVINGGPVLLVISDISNTTASPNCFSSTALVSNPASLEGLLVECFDGTASPDNLVDSCTILIIDPPTTPGSVSVSEGDIQVSAPSTWNITLNWDSGGNDGSVVYTVSSILLAAVNTTNTELTVPVELGMSYTFTVVTSDECGRTSAPSEMLTINVNVPSAPGSLSGALTLDQSDSSFSLSLQWSAVGPTAAIAVRGGGTLLVDGGIRGYLIGLSNGDSITVNCNTATCSSGVLGGQLTDGGLTASVAALNALGEGESQQATCSEVLVTRTASTPTNVTLTCPVEPCSITYRGSSENVDMVGTSGEPLEDLRAGEQYTYNVAFSCGNFIVSVQDGFNTCECPSSALLGGTGFNEVTCPLAGFAGALDPTGGSSGVVCYDRSEAVFVCSDAIATCTGNCAAECQCTTGQDSGTWNVTFQPLPSCVLPTDPPATTVTTDPPVQTAPTGLSTGVMVAIGILAVAVILALIIGVLLGMLLMYCITNKRLQQSSSHTEPATAAPPPPVYDVVGPGEKFEMEGNTAYGPVRR